MGVRVPPGAHFRKWQVMKKFLLLSCFIIIIAAVFLALNYKQAKKQGAQTPDNGKLKVAASFYPLAYFAEQISGGLAEVSSITPLGIEPHDFEPTPKDIIKIKSSDVFLFIGAGFDSWAEKLAENFESSKTIGLGLSAHFKPINNPHIWLDPSLAQKEALIIRDIFIEADPLNKDRYIYNGEIFVSKLADLDVKYQQGLANCKTRDIIVTHDAFSHLADRYSLTSVSIAGLSPDQETSPRQLGEIIKLVREKNIRFVFFEPLANKKFAETIALETNVEMLPLNPLEGLAKDEIEMGKDYFSIMEENLDNLRKALSCD